MAPPISMAVTPEQRTVSPYSPAVGVTRGGRAGTGVSLPSVVVIGCSGHGRVVVDAIEEDGRFRIAGLLDTFKLPGTELLAYEIIGSEADLPALIKAGVCQGVVVAVGDNWTRCQLVSRITKLAADVYFPPVIHPSAHIARNVSIGPGTVIMAGVVVNSGSRIGKFCILNTCASLDHDCVMDDFSSLAPRATTGGRVTIGSLSAIAIGATVLHEVYVGDHTVVGAGATVMKDVPAGVVAYGTPARIIRTRRPDDPYLEGARKIGPTSPVPTTRFGPSTCVRSVRLISAASSEWNEVLARTPHDFYHTSQYHEVQQRFGCGEACLAVYGGRDKFVAWPYLLRGIATPLHPDGCGRYDVTSAYGYCGPLAHGCADDDAFLNEAWAALLDLWRCQSVVSAFTRFHPLLGNHTWLQRLQGVDAATGANQVLSLGQTVAIDLRRSQEEIWSDYSRKARQGVRKCREMNITVEVDREWQHFDKFVELYYTTMRRNGAAGFYYFPAHYLRALKQAADPHATLMVARYEDQIISAAIHLEYGSIVNEHLVATDEQFYHLSPNRIMVHEAQAQAQIRANKYYHLGGGRGRSENDDLLRFKSAFSRSLYAFHVGCWILDHGVYNELSREREKQAELLKDRMPDEMYFPRYRAPFLARGVQPAADAAAASD